MRFLHGKMKVNKGGKITVTFSKPTRVLVMRDREYKKYRENFSFTYYGGHKESPYELTVPKSDVWHIIVEKGTHSNPENITASFAATHADASTQKHPRSLAKSLDEADAQLDAAEEAASEELEE